MARPAEQIPARNYATAVAWFVELARAHERRDRDREALARDRLRDEGVTVRFCSVKPPARVIEWPNGSVARAR